MAKINLKVEGMEDIARGFKQIGGVPQKYVTGAAKKSMSPALKRAKANAPYDTGTLKKGMKLTGEKSRHKGKKVYRIVFDRAYNEVFQKPNKEGKVTGYYPISQEYGFFTKSGSYIPGYRFIHEAFDGNEVERIVIDEMKSKIDQEIRKAGM